MVDEDDEAFFALFISFGLAIFGTSCNAIITVING